VRSGRILEPTSTRVGRHKSLKEHAFRCFAQQTVAVATITKVSLDRGFVLRELMDNALQAKKNQEWPASNRALELLGKELGMFNHPELAWDGDLATLTDQQLERITELFERAVYGDDRARLEADKRRFLRKAGLTIDVEVESSE